MSAIKKPSGAQKKRDKRDQLIKDVALRTGQLKISSLFRKSVESICQVQDENETQNEITFESASAAGQEIVLYSMKDKENIPQRNASPLIGSINLSVEWLLKNYDCLSLTRDKIDGKIRPFLHCNVCKQFENVAQHNSKNGSVYMAKGTTMPFWPSKITNFGSIDRKIMSGESI